MKITTVKGTNDYLPEEVRLRDYLQNQILNTYQDAGFERIMTPAVEDIENLDKSDGGDNLNLIFKILKRGDKLKKAMDSGDTNKLCDMGLRYDLTHNIAITPISQITLTKVTSIKIGNSWLVVKSLLCAIVPCDS